MRVDTEYGHLFVNKGAVLRMVYLGERQALVGDWEGEGYYAGKVYKEAEQFARENGITVVVTLDDPKMEEFYKKRGFTTLALKWEASQKE